MKLYHSNLAAFWQKKEIEKDKYEETQVQEIGSLYSQREKILKRACFFCHFNLRNLWMRRSTSTQQGGVFPFRACQISIHLTAESGTSKETIGPRHSSTLRLADFLPAGWVFHFLDFFWDSATVTGTRERTVSVAVNNFHSVGCSRFCCCCNFYFLQPDWFVVVHVALVRFWNSCANKR